MHTRIKDNIKVIFPYREKSNSKLNAIIAKLLEIIPDITIIVVDDNSTPSYSAENLPVKILKNKNKMGKGASIQRAIYEYLNKDNQTIAILTADADGQHCANDILKAITIWNNEKNNELILSGERDFKNNAVPFFSKIGNLFSSIMVFIETGIMIPDTQNGLRIYPISFFRKNKIYSNGFAFETETLVKALQKGYKFKSFPCETIYFPDRKSHFKIFRDSFVILGLHLKLMFSKIRTSTFYKK
ncbi:MAG TPA: glycosyltransferase family 2 protein [Victivallales bacterium]|nr:glycosyltransferase family 2 protein [Victivallales bacterium]HPO89674.1 glycosyltransferase family 2 protein [Victivallales bacterium]HRR27946.1 glycosyltransferase family 2 protein [Victivallales bacterium]HRU00508.1 glycosyltransferase family 2 protein [Victivallales bacterium]